MKKVSKAWAKRWRPAIEDMLVHYKGGYRKVRESGCPFCNVRDETKSSCSDCPWWVFESKDCKEAAYKFRKQSARRGHRVRCGLSILYLRQYPPLRWRRLRIKQLKKWLAATLAALGEKANEAQTAS